MCPSCFPGIGPGFQLRSRTCLAATMSAVPRILEVFDVLSFLANGYNTELLYMRASFRKGLWDNLAE